MRTGIQTGYRLMDKGPLRALSLILALWLAGCLLWDPARYATRPEGILLWQGIVLIWAVCTGLFTAADSVRAVYAGVRSLRHCPPYWYSSGR